MRQQGGRPEERVVVPDEVIPAGGGQMSQPGWSRRPATAGRSGLPLWLWFVGLIVAGALLVLGTSGIRTWWAHRLHDVTGGSKPAGFVIGLAIGALPLVGIAIGRLGTRGARRVIRMFLFGAAGFCVTYLLSPPLSLYVSGGHIRQVFDRLAPGYLAGVVTAELLWLLVVVFAWWRLRRWRRSWATRRQGPA